MSYQSNSGRRCDGFEPRAEFQRRYKAESAPTKTAPREVTLARRLVGSLSDTMTETRSKEKSAGQTPPGGETGYRLPLTLQRLYVEEQKTGEEIAEMYDVTPSTIYRWLGQHGIETRGFGHRSPESGLRYEMTVDNYMAWAQTESKNREKHFMFVHRLLAVAEYGVDAVAGNHVHHKNGIRWDNRPENLEVLSPSEHQSLHAAESRPSDEELLEDLRMGYEALGYPPRSEDINSFGEYSAQTYRKRFGSFAEALIEAGIKPGENQIQNERVAQKVQQAFGSESEGSEGQPAVPSLQFPDETTRDESSSEDAEPGNKTGSGGGSHSTTGLAAKLDNAEPDEVTGR